MPLTSDAPEALALSLALSVTSAAAEFPDALAVITEDRQLTFAELAALLEPAAPPVRSPDDAHSADDARSPDDAHSADAVRSPDDAPALAAAPPLYAAPLSAERTLPTLLAIYAALEQRRPLGLIHPQQPEPLRAHAAAALAAHAVPAGTAVVLFTSGSTSAPKGVVLSRRALHAAALAHAAQFPWRPEDRWLVALPLAHSGGLAAVIRCLVARKPLVLVETSGPQVGPQPGPQARPQWPLAEALAASATTWTSLVPTQLTALLDDETWQPPPSLRGVLVGGAACPPSLRRRALARGLPILVTYGMTETFGQVATATAPHDDASAIGPPLPGIAITAGTAAAPARIELAGAVCMTGYLGEPPLLEPRVATNDDGFLDERGHLHVLGRRDDIIITGGENVSPLAVEEMLRGTPHLVDACVFGLPDPRWGQVIGAALVVSPTFELASAIAHWAQALPPSHRPRAIAFTAQLPLGATGKVDRRAAADLADRQLLVYPPSPPPPAAPPSNP